MSHALHWLARQKRGNVDPLSMMFGPQLAAAQDTNKAIALLCGRRAGKTWWVLLMAIKAMLDYPRCKVPYVALTRMSAQGILWSELQKVNEALGLGFHLVKSELRAYAPNGSVLFLVGANKADEIEKLRGQAYPFVAIDEAASFRPSLLHYLIEDVLEACLMDYDGTMALVGTPSASCLGFFHDVTSGIEAGFSCYHWTALDNPYLENAALWLERKRAAKKWGTDHPTYRREYMGEWIRDESALVYRALVDDINLVSEMPEGYDPLGKGWAHVLGIDYGYVDSTAHVLWAFRTTGDDKSNYAVKSFKQAGWLPSEAARETNTFFQQYSINRAVGDAGGLGKAYIEEARRRFELPILNAAKTEKIAHIELMNDSIATGQAKWIGTRQANGKITGPNVEYLEEMSLLQWDMERVQVTASGAVRHESRKVIDERFEDHLCDAGLYGNRASTSYYNELHPEEVEDPSRDVVDEDADQANLRPEDEAGRVSARKRRQETWWDQ